MPNPNFFKEKVIPDIFERVQNIMRTKIESAKHISITTDTSKINNNSDETFVSFTAHWISDEFEIQHGFLGSRLFSEGDGDAISDIINKMFMDWNIEQNRIHVVVRDSVPENLQNEQCFLHTLQCAIMNSIKSQSEIEEMIVASRKIVRHLKHSTIQNLTQDVPNRWNSTYYMLQALLEHKQNITTMLASQQLGKIQNLEGNQWSILEATINLLQPFEEITKIISKAAPSCISDVIPSIASLQLYLSRYNSTNANANASAKVQTMKEELEMSLTTRLNYLFGNESYNLATFLDPRYKLKFFPETMRHSIKENVISKILQISADSDPPSMAAKPENSNTNVNSSKFWDCFNEASGAQTHGSGSKNFTIRSEIELYGSTPLLDRTKSPIDWWKSNKSVFPTLATLVQKYMCAPASCVYSEPLYSEPGNLYEDKRNR